MAWALPAYGHRERRDYQSDLHASESALEWVVSGYLLAFAVALVTGGRLGDIFERKAMFLIGLTGFTLASALCAGAWTADILVGARALQGFCGSHGAATARQPPEPVHT